MRDEIREELAKGIDPLFTLSMDDDEVNELKKRISLIHNMISVKVKCGNEINGIIWE